MPEEKWNVEEVGRRDFLSSFLLPSLAPNR